MEIDKYLKNRLKRPKKRNREGGGGGWEINNVSNKKKKEFELILNFMHRGKIES